MIKRIGNALVGKFREKKSWLAKYLEVFILDFIGKGSGFLLLPWYLQQMTQVDFGIYTYIIYLISVTASVLSLGFNAALSKLYFEYEEHRGQYLFSTTVFLLSFVLLLFAVLYFSSTDIQVMQHLVAESKFNYLDIRHALFGYIIFFVIYNQLNVYFQVAQRIRTFQYFNIARIIGMNLFVLWFLSYQSESSYSTRLNWEACLSICIFGPLIYKYFSGFEWKFNWVFVKRTLSIGLPVAGASVFAILYTISDKYFLQAIEGMQNLANYNLALQLATPLGLLLSTFNLIWIPIFFKEKDSAISFRKTATASKYLTLAYLAVAAGIFLICYGLISIGFIPATYLAAFKIFPFVVIAIIFDGLSQLYNNFVISFEKTWVSLVMTAGLGILMFTLNRFFVPLYGITATIAILVFLAGLRFWLVYIFAVFQLKKAAPKVPE